MIPLVLAFQIVLATLTAAQVSQEEQRVVEWIDANSGAALALTERLVNINSGTMNFTGVREVADVLAREFEPLGFETEWIDGSGFGRAGHLVARRIGGASDRLGVLLIGHLDTVFEPDSPFQAWERLDAGHARGPGATDMKGGDVIMLYALKALDSVGALERFDVWAVFTGDEEKSGKPLDKARASLREAARATDVALGFEDGDGDPKTAVIARRGSGSWTLTVTGRPAHSSQIFQPDVGAGAIYEASRILVAFYEGLRDETNLTFNPGVILGGTDVDFDASRAKGTAFGKNNVIAERAIVAGDLRASSPEQYERATAQMLEIVADHLPGTQAELTFSPSYPPMAASPGNHKLLALYDEVSRDLDFGPVEAVNPRNAGAADISFTASDVEMALDGLGLMGMGGHTVNEVADLATLPMQTKRAAVTLLRLAALNSLP